MKYNRWDDSKIDTDLFLQLQDLSTILSNNPDLKFEYKYGSFIDISDKKVTGSHFWDINSQEKKENGYKTDVFLRTIGTLKYSHLPIMKAYLKETNQSSLSRFATQLFTLLEDLRLEEIIKKNRPGTKKDFATRTNYLKHYFQTQLTTNVTKSYPLDELFCLIYLVLQADKPDPTFPRANEQQLLRLEKLKPLIYSSFEAKSTNDTTRIAEQILIQLEEAYSDMINVYFSFPIAHIENYERNTLFDELTRTDELANDDQEDVDNENNEYFDEQFSTWHTENQNNDRKQTFLQFDLEVGTKTSIMGGGARETEDGDQAMGTIQGQSGQSKNNDYSESESLEKQGASEGNQTNKPVYGEENKHAVAIVKKAESPSREDHVTYQKAVNTIQSHKRKLASTIEKVLEHKRNAPRKDLVMGRLSKKLLPAITDENPRLFYKKNEESKEIDAVFTLLVDCSASMHNKMDETKKGIILFHEVLNQLKIPHSIIGFWEDANDVKESYQPNYFHNIHSFTDSFYQNRGARIMQLEPEEDNRDGFSIRIITEELAARREKHKFLLVFSDGEPAAANYDQNGIIDTNVAVSEARKKGIDVIGMFLADGEIDEREDLTMKNIYGKERLMIPSVDELPEHFAPLLKKLLLRTI
ncbi:nitric oxide reductase activation protein [Virgibacillus natechei]|uniref:Nitric oxide reductase activation protein n=1 Tax=Virgibacillus natechei TaxID=1216297 RepID=A0ABS4IDS5_9BACI|nr:VWA domain-containing protein [Virgibacillus natechei]MBP1969092.1 nitric oxide reductase activation protein [Virgibacillus natechei]UZD14359.1 VWA domain-containing protein [Virgibacillus natechei]